MKIKQKYNWNKIKIKIDQIKKIKLNFKKIYILNKQIKKK